MFSRHGPLSRRGAVRTAKLGRGACVRAADARGMLCNLFYYTKGLLQRKHARMPCSRASLGVPIIRNSLSTAFVQLQHCADVGFPNDPPTAVAP